MSVIRNSILAGVAVAAIGAGIYFAPGLLNGQSGPKVTGPPPPPQMRRMTESQYRNSVADIFSPEIKVVGRFEPDIRVDGLAAVGASEASISGNGYEQYYAMAGRIAEQVVSDENWAKYMPCDVPAPATYDAACAEQIISEYGEKIFRRDMKDVTLAEWLQISESAMEKLGNFHEATGLVLEGMLSSPEFLFIMDTVTEGEDGSLELTGHAKAARISYFLWNTAPDEELLRAASAGELDTKDGLEAQVDRMLNSEHVRTGMNAFFEDFLHLDAFATLEKDKLIYPAFNQRVSEDGREQVLRFLDYHLLDKAGPYTDIFTAKETFVTRPLGMIYEVPVRAVEGWEKVEFTEDDPRGGLLSHIAFSALHAHPGRSSATLRGIAVRELLLCQSVAPAPAAVNFTVVQDTSNPEFKTARARLTQHRTDDACASCHEFIDPIGLAMENFDGVGRLRYEENGAVIDVSGAFDGYEFDNVDGLEETLADHPATTSCLVEKMQKYATGRKPQASDIQWINRLEKKFSRSDEKIIPLLREIALSDEFFAVSAPQVPVPDVNQQEAATQTREKKS